MADQYLDPEQGSQPGGAPAPGANGPGIADAWRGFLQEPSNRAFMLQAGLALMQPRPVGQSTMGHLASGISQGGAAANAVQVADERRAEAESVQTARAKSTDARLMGADAALSRAAATETNADTRRMLAEKAAGRHRMHSFRRGCECKRRSIGGSRVIHWGSTKTILICPH